MEKLSLDIVIVNWNSAEQLEKCLISIENAEKRSFVLSEVMVVDNNSTDDSLNFTETFSFALRILNNKNNKGFGVACNQGAEKCKADFILFLNPDVQLYKDSLDVSMGLFGETENKKLGALGIQLLNESGKISRSCARLPNPSMFYYHTIGLDRFFSALFKSHLMLDWEHDKTRNVDHVMGAYYLLRRSLFIELGGFDPRYFVYLEDLDLSCRVWQAGFEVLYITETQAFHKGCGTSEQVKARRLFYALRSRILYAAKHFERRQALFVLLLTICCEPIIRIFFGAARLSWSDIVETTKTYGMLYSDLPLILKTSGILHGNSNRKK